MKARRSILTFRDIEERTTIPVATLRYYRATGQGPRTFRLGGRVVAFEDDVEAWIEEQYAAESRSHGGGVAESVPDGPAA